MTIREAKYLLKNTAWLAPSLEPIDEAIEMACEALDKVEYINNQLGKADRKTENSSEIPNNCEDEPMKTEDYCDICKRDMCEVCVADATNPYCVPSHYEINYEPKDEPQTKGVWNAGYKTGYDKGYKDVQKVKESPSLVKDLVKDLVKAFCEDGTWLERQGVYNLTLAEAKQRAVDIIESVLPKDEPQTERSE